MSTVTRSSVEAADPDGPDPATGRQPGPLAGFRILDLTSVVMGPYATVQLGDLGADIIKVEPPQGDLVRQIGPGRSPGFGGMFLGLNRSKRSIVIDLKIPAGRDTLLRLARSADVVVYNMRPKAMARLGLGYETFRVARSDIVFVGLVGYGQEGPYAPFPAYDDLIQGASGVPALIAASGGGTPRYAPVNIADRTVGLFAAQAILAALLHRERTGEGQSVEVPMFETMAGFVLGDHLGGQSYRPPLDQGGYARLLSRHRQPYATQDGHICVLIYTDKQWRAFFEAIGTPEAMADPRFRDYPSRSRNIDAVYEEAGRIFRTRTTAAWAALLERADIPNTPMHTLASIQEDPHLRAVGFFQDVEHPHEGTVRQTRPAARYSASPAAPSRLAPALGEHTAEILAEAGFGEDEVRALLASGAVQRHEGVADPAPAIPADPSV